MSETDPTEQLAGECLDDRFELVELVARGGHGVVYRGVHRSLRCPIAVKLLACDADSDFARARFVEQFENEARTVASLRHPAIVRVIDHGVATCSGQSLPYLVLDWVEGETLEALLRRDSKPRGPKQALALLRPVFDAIACAHDAGVVHRDIKPANIMVARDEKGEPSPRVLDFGIAKMMRPEELVSSGSTVTTDDFSSFSLSHAAPEQVARMRTGPWTDVHSLALLLVEVLVGQRAYQAVNNVELFAKITAPKRPTPASFGRRVGPWEAALVKALSVVVAERYANARSLLRALEATLDAAQSAWDSPEDTPTQRRSAAPVRARRAPAAVLVAGLALCSIAIAVRARSHGRSVSASPAASLSSPRESRATIATPEPARNAAVTVTAASSTTTTTVAPSSASPRRVPSRAAPTNARARSNGRSLIDDEVAIQ